MTRLSKLEPSHLRRWLLLLILLLEVSWVSWYMQSTSQGIFAKRGSLVRAGSEFLFGWIDQHGTFQVTSYKTAEEALRFAEEELSLHPGRNPFSDDNIEHIWRSDRRDKFLVLWKRFDHDFVHQLTFDMKLDALFFEQMFRAGAYSTSPLGHSVNFVPVHQN